MPFSFLLDHYHGEVIQNKLLKKIMVVRNNDTEHETKLLNPKVMDGPVIRTTVNDIFQSNPKLFLTYHVVGAGWDFLCPVGVLLGGSIYRMGYHGPFRSIYPMMGTTGLMIGSMGSLMGYMGLQQAAAKGELNTPIPYNTEGIQQRVDGLRHNYKVRVMDLCAWTGIIGAATLLVYKGGPSKLIGQPGVFGTIQTLTLGSAMGSVVGFGFIAYQSSY
jgi:hypothetical protein